MCAFSTSAFIRPWSSFGDYHPELKSKSICLRPAGVFPDGPCGLWLALRSGPSFNEVIVNALLFPPIGPKKQPFKAVLRGCVRMLKCHLNQCPYLHAVGASARAPRAARAVIECTCRMEIVVSRRLFSLVSITDG